MVGIFKEVVYLEKNIKKGNPPQSVDMGLTGFPRRNSPCVHDDLENHTRRQKSCFVCALHNTPTYSIAVTLVLFQARAPQ